MPAAISPTRSTPACATLEYASMRLMLFWRRAAMLPTVMVTAAMMEKMLAQPIWPKGTTSPPRAPTKTRIMPAIAADLTAAAIKAVTGVGAPS